MNTYLRWVIIVGVCAVLFTPLIVIDSLFFPFIVGKGIFFRVIVEIITAAWVILAITDPQYRPRRSPVLLASALFIIIIALADMFGMNPSKSFLSNFERMEGWITLAHLFAYLVVASSVLKTQKIWNWFFNTSIYASLITAFFAFLQISGYSVVHQGGSRVDGTLGNATYLAIYMMFHIFIVAYLMAAKDSWVLAPGISKPKQKIIAGIVLLLIQGFVLFQTETRGAMLGLIAGVFIASLIVLVFEKQWTVLRKTSLGVLVASIVLVAGFLAIKDTAFVKNSSVLSRFASISLTERTTQSRFMLWNIALQGVKERPILGWGQENFNYVFNQNYDPKMYNQEQWFDRTHNVVFDWLIAGGVLGLLSYLAFFGSVLWLLWNKKQARPFSVVERALFTGLLVGYFIQNLTVFDNITSYILFFSIAAFIVFRTTEQVSAPVTEAPKDNVYAAPIAAVVLVVMLYMLNVRPLLANQALLGAIRPNQTLEQSLAQFRQALSYNTYGNAETREQMMTLVQQIGDQQVSGKEIFIQTAYEEGKKQIAATPKDARYYLLLGSTMTRVTSPDEGLALLKTALELSPRKQSILFEIGIGYMAKMDYAEATKAFKQAFDSEPNYQEARIIYAVGLIYSKQFAEAEKLVSVLPSETIINDERIMRAYYDAKNYQKVIALWKERVALRKTADAHTSLAAAYLLIDDRKNAIAELRKAIELNPSFKEQGEAIIKDIQAGKKLI